MSKITRMWNSDYALVGLLLVLGVLNFGWVYSENLGVFWVGLNAFAFLGVVIAAVFYKITKRLSSDNAKDQ